MKQWITLPLLALSAFVLMACSESPKPAAPTPAPEAATAPAPTPAKPLVVGLDDNFPPMGFRDEAGTLVGFDIDLAREATTRMGVTAEFRPIDWSAKEAELASKRIDMLWNGLTITPERMEKIAFSKPYMENHQIIVVGAKRKSPLANKAELAGKIVGVQEGSSAVDAIAKEPAVQKSFKELRLYPDNVKALLDLELGRLDAVVLDEVVGRYYVAKKADTFKVLQDNFGTEEYGVGMRKDDSELLNKLNATLDAMKADGTSEKIAQKWFGYNVIK